MPAKLIMRWDIQSETESEYFEFLVHEFIPAMTKLGIAEIQVWYTAYGECEQKMAEGVTSSAEQMHQILRSEEWETVIKKLETFVNNFSQKIIPATRGFQI